jgi:hypothetical protein
MFREKTLVDKIKKVEGSPKIEKIFSQKELEDIKKLYGILPLRVFNQKQNIKKKVWIQGFNKVLDDMYFTRLNKYIGNYKMDNLKDHKGQDLYGIYHESFSPLKLHVDSGFEPKDIIYKQVVTPLTSGETIIFKQRWYQRSTNFTVDIEELKFKPNQDQNDRSNKHIGEKNFDLNIYKKYLSHIDYNNLSGLEVEMIYSWKVGESLIMDRSHIHCSSSNIVNGMKLGLTTFTTIEY